MFVHASKMILNFNKKSGLYKNSTGSLTFNPVTCEAHSFRWWKFVAKVDGLVIFNNYNYSNTTAKQQSKIRTLLDQLNIKIDLALPLPKGIDSSNLSDLILTAEEYLCDKISNEELKKEERNKKAKARKLKKQLEDYLENTAHFRDYEIRPMSQFTHYNKVAVHQIVDKNELQSNVENALHNFHRDNFPSIVFYVEGL